MTIEQYQKESSRTFLTTNDHDKDILHCLIGMQTEIGELVDAYKKHIYYGKPLDKVNVSEEIADTQWYIQNLCRLENIDFNQALINNIEKLKIRYPEKFTKENAIERDLIAERKELEK